jgi:hypothetical protein
MGEDSKGKYPEGLGHSYYDAFDTVKAKKNVFQGQGIVRLNMGTLEAFDNIQQMSQLELDRESDQETKAKEWRLLLA